MRSVPTPLRPILPLLLALVLASAALAQPLPDAAEDALFAARSAMQQAIADDVPPFPDQPLWAEAIRQAERAVELAPDHERTLGLRAEVYSRSTFYGPAWQAWRDYLAAGHALGPDQAPLFVEVGQEYAWSFYERGERARAAEVHLAVLDAVPFAKESRVWMGRIRMEQGRPADAIPYWEAVVAQDPDEDRARYFLDLARDQARWGVAAADAFRTGVQRYEDGEMDAAARAFERASDANPRYPAAWAWRGRIAFERGAWLVAREHYARALELAPGDETYRYFRDEAARRLDAESRAAEEAAAADADEAAGDEADESAADDATEDEAGGDAGTP
jgi:tetratricopeptide (TPR) repeat protein